MARGRRIVVSAEPGGKFMEGYIASGQTPKPGTILQRDATVALRGGRHTYKLYDRAADGDNPLGPIFVLLEDRLQGKTVDDAYAAGDRCFLYTPISGDELNCLLGDVTGTGDTHALGEALMVDDGTGQLVITTGTPQQTPFLLLEAVTPAPTAATLAWVQYGL